MTMGVLCHLTTMEELGTTLAPQVPLVVELVISVVAARQMRAVYSSSLYMWSSTYMWQEG